MTSQHTNNELEPISNVQKERSEHNAFTRVVRRNKLLTQAALELPVGAHNSTEHPAQPLPATETALSKLVFGAVIDLL